MTQEQSETAPRRPARSGPTEWGKTPIVEEGALTDLSRLDPEIRDALAAQALRYFRVFGEKGSAGSRKALFQICKIAIRSMR